MTQVSQETQTIAREAGAQDVNDEAAELDGGASAVEVAESWLAQLAERVSVPASDVQDHLLDLWGALDEGPVRSEVERWLTETLGRNLYSVTDINGRLETLLPTS